MNFDAEYYRNHFRAWLKLKGLTHDDFVKKYPGTVTRTTLSAILSGSRSPSFAAFFKLLKPLKLSDEELYYLFMLKVENDLDHTDADDAHIQKWLKQQRLKITAFLRGDYGKPSEIPMRPESIYINEYFTRASSKERIALLKQITKEIDKQITLHTDERPGRKILNKILKEIK